MPLLALAAELTDHTLHIVTDRRAASLVGSGNTYGIIKLHTGKFRRYRGRGWLERVTDLKTLAFNIRDLFLLALGIVQSLWHVANKKPDVVFLNGGAIGVPVSIACRIFRIPYLVHESDTVPGLANRFAAKHASVFLFGLKPSESTLKSISIPTDVVGIQPRSEFIQARQLSVREVRQELQLPINEHIILITGGSLGGKTLVELVLKELESILDIAHVVHITGNSNFEAAQKRKSMLLKNVQHRYQPIPYLKSGMARYMMAADLIVSRAGATTLSELAFLGKPAIIVPNSRLTGGHQDSNAMLFKQAGAAVVLRERELETNSDILVEAISSLLGDNKKIASLSKGARSLLVDGAGDVIISHILQVGEGGR